MPGSSDARVALLRRLIDHAPTFPPASLPPAQALAADRAARESPDAWLLGRLVWPASLVGELGEERRELSLVLDAPAPSDSRVAAVEARGTADLGALAGVAPEVYVELPVDEGLEERVAALARLGLRAKVRCGGAAVPGIEQLARFLRVCVRAGVPLKATAGLHAAVRAGGAHGFLNLLAAVVFGDEEAALAEEDAGAFVLDAASFRWRGRSAGAPELERARRELLHAIGSCSFAEPVEELRRLGMLP